MLEGVWATFCNQGLWMDMHRLREHTRCNVHQGEWAMFRMCCTSNEAREWSVWSVWRWGVITRQAMDGGTGGAPTIDTDLSVVILLL